MAQMVWRWLSVLVRLEQMGCCQLRMGKELRQMVVWMRPELPVQKVMGLG